MTGPRRALVVMAKEPESGVTKTRLVPRLTPGAAARLYQCFLLDALDLARSIPGVTPFVAVSPPGAGPYFRRLAPDVAQVQQVGATLGERLDHVLTECLAAGFDHVAAMGSDVPTLPSDHVVEAFDILAGHRADVVIGPSDDGGYHLVGWSHPHPALVREVEMSTPRVVADTLALAAAHGVRVALLPNWYDVDRPEDLDRLTAELRSGTTVGRHTRAFLEQAVSGGGP